MAEEDEGLSLTALVLIDLCIVLLLASFAMYHQRLRTFRQRIADANAATARAAAAVKRQTLHATVAVADATVGMAVKGSVGAAGAVVKGGVKATHKLARGVTSHRPKS
jgi:hypothetical protein